MRKFLLDRNIHVTFLRYFYRPSRGTAAAQLNVNMDDEHLVKQSNFWPEGIFMKRGYRGNNLLMNIPLNKNMDGTKRQLTLMCWNCRRIFSCIPYLSECLRETNVSICALSEHWLRTFQLHVLDAIDDNYVSIGKSSDEGNPTAITCNYRPD